MDDKDRLPSIFAAASLAAVVSIGRALLAIPLSISGEWTAPGLPHFRVYPSRDGV